MKFVRVMLGIFLLSLLWGGFSWGRTYRQRRVNRRQSSKVSLLSRRTIGDVTLRIGAGARLIEWTDMLGEFNQKYLGESGTADIIYSFEYAYFWRDDTALIFSLPLIVSFYPSVVPLFTLNAGFGLRRYLIRYLFVEGQVFFSPFSRSIFRLEFAGFMFAIGTSIPFLSRYRFFMNLQFPFNFTRGLQVGIDALIGVAIFF